VTYLAISERSAETISSTLLAAAPAESGMFALAHLVTRGGGMRIAIGSPIWDVELAQQHEGSVEPSGRMISAAVSVANRERCGLAFVHTHPRDPHPPGLSLIDYETTIRLGAAFDDLLDGPFASLVVSPGGWGGALYRDGDLFGVESIAVIGRRLRLYRKTTIRRQADERDNRQRQLLGSDGNLLLRSLRVAVVGVGGTGSPIAETLARIGVSELTLIDPDTLEPSNARRVFSSRGEDARSGASKVQAVTRGLTALDLGTRVVPVEGDVREVDVHGHLLDCDVVFGATDNHASRSVLTELSARAHLPLIDVGVRGGLRSNGALDALYAERRLQIPDGPCLWCWGVLDAEQVRLELMPPFEREALAAEGYVAGLDEAPEPTIAPLTVTAAGLATSTLLGLLGGGLESSPLRAGFEALRVESIAYADERDPGCVCGRWRPA
jgi:molybdopterin-synthase adenylyltransferase